MNRKARRRAAALARKSRAKATPAESRSIALASPPLASAPWRAALLGSIATGALLAAAPRPAIAGPDGCATVGATATCQSNQSAGITNEGGAPDFTSPPVTTLNVNTLTQNIAPALNVRGIGFRSDGDITITSDTGPFVITTQGNLAAGIFARTEMGGNLTVTHTGDLITTGMQSDGIEVSATGAGNTMVTHTGNITTSGPGASDGIYAGSTNGDTTVTQTGDISTVGDGGNGIYVGTVAGNLTVTQTGDISTMGVDAAGLRARGGVGDITLTQIGDITTAGTRASGISVVEFGAGPNDITITQTGNIVTSGGRAAGILARSYNNANVTIVHSGDITTLANNGYGFSHGIYVNNLNGGNISVTNTGNISTLDDYSVGILANNQTGDGATTVTQTGDISTMGAGSGGILALSSGAGAVTVTQTGDIATMGNGANTILLFNNVSGDVTLTATGTLSTQGTNSSAIYAYDNGTGSISITRSGDITTQQTNSKGIFARDYPGDGNITITSTGNISTNGTVSQGIYADDTGGTGNVSVISIGNITTTGDNSNGLDARKQAGAGNVTVNLTGNITVGGANSSGVNVVGAPGSTNVVTLAGGTVQGGSGTGAGVFFSDTNAPTFVLNNAASLSALSGVAVRGGAGGETVNNTGTVAGAVNLGGGADVVNLDAAGTHSAATFDGGMDNDILRLSGGGTNTLDGAQHMNFEVFEQTGSGTWTLTGNNNFSTSATVAGGTLNLNGNLISPTVTNQATLTTGGQGQIGSGTITGNFVQTATGTLAADVDLAAATADRINVTGSANLAGTVAPTFLNLTPGTQQVTILSAAGGTTNNGLGLTNFASPLVNAELLFPNATDVALGVSVDFTPDGLNANQTNIANNLSAALGAGTLGSITDALLTGITNLADYQSALEQLSPEVYLNSETASLFAAEAFINNLFSCPVAGGGAAFIAESQCVWVRPQGRFLDRDGDADAIGFDEHSYGFSAGAQFALAPNWFAGFAFGYENASLDNDRGAESDSERFSGGGVIKYQSGPILLAAAVSGGSADFDTQRALASSDHDVAYIAGQVRAAYLLDQGRWYAKPLVDLNLTHIDRDGFTENGAGAANLTVGGSDDVYFSVSPAIELGAEIAIDKDTSLRPFIRAGATVYEDDSHALTARFAGAPAGLNDFVTRSEFDDVVADIEAGVTAFSGDRVTLSLSYEGHLGADIQQHGGMAQVSVKF